MLFLLLPYISLCTTFPEHGSAEFVDFLNLLGDEVELAGWEYYKGGLDIKRM